VYVMVPHAHRPGSPPRGAHARSVTGARAVCDAHATSVLCVTHISAPTTESRGPLWGVVAHYYREPGSSLGCGSTLRVCCLQVRVPAAARRPPAGHCAGVACGTKRRQIGSLSRWRGPAPAAAWAERARLSCTRVRGSTRLCARLVMARSGRADIMPARRPSLSHTHTHCPLPSLPPILPPLHPPSLPPFLLSLSCAAPRAVRRGEAVSRAAAAAAAGTAAAAA
jgi:hypothetical protein